MIMDKLINSGILTLSVVLLAIIAIIFLFLKYRQNDGKCKVHMYYISGLLIFIIIELITYVCVNNNNTDQIVDYISFASTISSLFLSVVAIIYAIVSNNQGEAQYQKIDRASDKISVSVDRFSLISESLSGSIDSILLKLDEIKVISSETKNAVSQNNQKRSIDSVSASVGMDETDNKLMQKIVERYVKAGSFYGNIVLLACILSNEKKLRFKTSDIVPDSSTYLYGYIIASAALGIIAMHIDDDYITVDSISSFLSKEILLEEINNFIEKSKPEVKEFNRNVFEKVNKFFE
ncbi:hypothetical protein [Bacteroides sp. OF04-15BH]|uniref:hypothetical protein n=1 Tax=Bacteroides sp. OF04-15BH TaxID=2292281 RepID=UPI000E4F8CCC|nr:hypothetical protein [Bacteroides sp. OF04-15BH]RHP65414.1 hypothetical protein DXA74_06470 [Bacteroides sp. OF04-15BH]